MAEVERLAREHRPQADHRRLVGLPAAAGLRRVPPDRRRGRRLPDGGHGALRRAGRRRAAPVPGAARARRHHHHAQDPRRPARRRHPRPTTRRSPRRSTPRCSPASRAARWSTSSPPRRWRSRSPPSRRSGSARSAPCAGARILADRLLADDVAARRDQRAHRRHRRAPGAGRPARLRAGRQAGRGPAAPDRHHRQPQRRARSTRARRWSPPAADRHPGAGHPRLRRRRLRRGRRHHRRRAAARRSTTTSAATALRARVTALADALPALPGPRRGAPHDRRHDRRAPRAPTCPSTPTSCGATRSRRRSYDVVIVGGGGHGLATAYYLAKNHGITNVAVLEKGWLAGGNMARNTTIIRSNYLWDESAGDLRALPQAVGGPGGRPRLPDPVQPARRAQPRAQPAGRPRQRAPGRGQQAQRHRRRVARRRTRSRSSARSSTSPPTSATRCSAPPTSRGPASPSTTTSPGASPARADDARRRPHPELRGHRLRHATATGSPGVRTTRGAIAAGQVAPVRGRAHLGAGRHGRAAAARSRATRCRRWSPSCSSRCTRPW